MAWCDRGEETYLDCGHLANEGEDSGGATVQSQGGPHEREEPTRCTVATLQCMLQCYCHLGGVWPTRPTL
jgi:hypothetical protein